MGERERAAAGARRRRPGRRHLLRQRRLQRRRRLETPRALRVGLRGPRDRPPRAEPALPLRLVARRPRRVRQRHGDHRRFLLRALPRLPVARTAHPLQRHPGRPPLRRDLAGSHRPLRLARLRPSRPPPDHLRPLLRHRLPRQPRHHRLRTQGRHRQPRLPVPRHAPPCLRRRPPAAPPLAPRPRPPTTPRPSLVSDRLAALASALPPGRQEPRSPSTPRFLPLRLPPWTSRFSSSIVPPDCILRAAAPEYYDCQSPDKITPCHRPLRLRASRTRSASLARKMAADASAASPSRV
mmetsp:Transcript_13636/g.43071  ORF Transcript_13636/g.43071 Transcript_13636/m.43071 type:complete len:295 (-) Transcript_13636:68-952(-)